ncbi:hypothetical protein IMCC20628_04268 [Hoeflea sp. IMCC20628]|uniref:hypothetical protein n=1 Tax=Hoeflea sp. IMCC20628 TaxID=1620421 RepID=UPI00063AA7A4|nr:hypothetical protein [Hoeflea sp. IMCC20628]AKI02945.1 hypothetical protein IMCC20628_04268 [Hoeflea sp. IMCC20628]
MRKIVAFFLGLGLIAAAFAGLALAIVVGILSAILVVTARLTGRWQPAMVRTADKGHRRDNQKPHDFKVSNDGRGTIIDM